MTLSTPPVYLESSALLRMLFDEPGSEDISAAMGAAAQVITSRLTQVEAYRALLRAERRRSIEPREVPALRGFLAEMWSHVVFMEIDEKVCTAASQVAPASPLRSLDALHLATYFAVKEHEPALRMLSFDQRLLAEI